MTSTSWKDGRDLIVYTGKPNDLAPAALRTYIQKHDLPWKIAFIVDKKQIDKLNTSKADIVIPCDFKNETKTIASLTPFKERFLAITASGEVNLEWLARIIPHVPYLRTPTADALNACLDKITMRKRFRAANPKITPRFTVVKDGGMETIEKIEKKVGYPLVVKPSGLASSILVTICFHREELQTALRKCVRKIHKVQKDYGSMKTPKILVEQFMDGQMYSVDGYVSSRGKVRYCPLVKVITGRQIGFDDFFGYARSTPTTLSKAQVTQAQKVATEGIHALGLKNSTAHVELMQTDAGWKIVEIGARVGGNRHRMYELAFGINHYANDALNRIPGKYDIPTRTKGHFCVLDFFPKTEGFITSIKGIRKTKTLASMHTFKQHLFEGEKSVFAKNGGKRVITVTLFNKERSDLLADVRRTEKLINIETSKRKRKTKN